MEALGGRGIAPLLIHDLGTRCGEWSASHPKSYVGTWVKLQAVNPSRGSQDEIKQAVKMSEFFCLTSQLAVVAGSANMTYIPLISCGGVQNLQSVAGVP
jgi:hypothetical protein